MSRQIDPAKLDHVDRKVMGDIEKHGWSDISVFPTEDMPGLPFNYTVGLVDMSHPDLLVMGMHHEQMHGIFCSAVEQIEKGTRFNPDEYYSGVLVDYRVAFVDIDEPFDNAYPMSMCRRLYGHVQAQQLVWPDRNDRFPWHNDFEDDLKDYQELLGTWKGAV